MSLEQIVMRYGYIALVAGTFLEGETILVIGGFLAHLGYLKLQWVIASAFAGSLLGDQLFFFIGRFRGPPMLEKKPSWKEKANKADRMLAAFNAPLIVGFRFLYGLRTVTPFVIGMSSVATARFMALNALGAFLWACAISYCGYFLGQALETIIGDIRRYELEALAAIAAVGSIVWAVYFIRKRA